VRCFFSEYSNKFISLESAEIKVYDAMGKVTNKYKKGDMFTTAVSDGLVEDGMGTFFEVTAASYPVTLN
jgi:hypothetical protein